ncbi:ABC-F family ATP-binding cassette domain-containing protein [Candidatus Acetothermia bacterium]|jgi:ATP-binding cassette subfamily F protein 3|nr:ABC-F family ATP-binding cassette domain-containing protein [Candidatus Acetothermia bacterium]MCI2427937.1 ABC-F family ATP-binding cassette domain-containing protein [Candidatus Acetothermia bacterium]MCI2428953.1 ABC-F family ATP-binding cassette domain-containing protein [Candidatus Acetothermia bacterium]
MSQLTLQHIEKVFGDQILFRDVCLQIDKADRILLVGANGTGKSTLLRIIAGEERPTAGRINKAHNLKITYLPQTARLQGTDAIISTMRSSFNHLRVIEQELRKLEAEMEQADPDLLQRYDELLIQFKVGGGYAYEATIQEVLTGLGLPEPTWHKSPDLLSDGELSRAALAKTILEEPDLLLLDEPSNHLDFAALEWLEEYLLRFTGSIILVSHDRYLLDRVGTETWEIVFGEIRTYPGNYSRSQELRAAEQIRIQKTYDQQRLYIAKQEEFIRRNLAGQKSRQAKDREKKLTRLNKLEPPSHARNLTLRIPSGTPSGKYVIRLDELEVGFASTSQSLFRCPNLVVYRGEKVAIIGPNGCGKTTLLKTIRAEIPPLSGVVTHGHNVRIAYYSQRHDELRGNDTLLGVILARSDLTVEQAHSLLGRFLFSGITVEKQINTLSGGEQSRVALALLSLMEGNLLLLDEPTNQLDLPSRAILQRALIDYQGTIIMVSHDRALLNAVATQIWDIRDGQLHVFSGDYAYYKEKRSAIESTIKISAQSKKTTDTASIAKKKKKPQLSGRQQSEAIMEIEAVIAQLDEEIAEIERQLIDPRLYEYQRVAELGTRHKELKAKLNEQYRRWEELINRQEEK